MNIVNYYKEILNKILIKEFSLEYDDIKNISFEFPKDSSLGDFSTNAAMLLAGRLKISPNEVAKKIIDIILNTNDINIESAELAGKT